MITFPLLMKTKNNKILNFYKTFIKRGALCFDIGAHIGERSDVFLDLGANVICVEPQKTCVHILKSKYKNNRHIKVLDIGLGASAGIMVLSICSSNTTISTFSEKWKTGRFKENRWNENYEVEIKTLDEIINIYGIPDFCKIDVEGFENDVINGLSTKIPLLSFEFTSEFIEDAKKCCLHLESLGKVVYNFALGDNIKPTIEFEFTEWVNQKELFDKISSSEIQKLWGDIYARFINN